MRLDTTNKRLIILLLIMGLMNWVYHNRALLLRPKVALAIAIIEITGNNSYAWGHWGTITVLSVSYLQNNIDPLKDRTLVVRMLQSSNAVIRSITLSIITLKVEGELPSDDPIYKTVAVMAQNDFDDKVRSSAIYALGLFQNQDACALLKEMYTPDNKYFKGGLADSLKRLNCPNIAELLKPPPPRSVSVLMNILLPAFYGGGWHGDYTAEQQQAEDELGTLAVTHFAEFLPYLKSQNAGIRMLTMDFISSTKKPEAFAPIVEILQTDPILDVRYTAVINLGVLGDKRACQILAKVLKQKSFGTPLPRDYPLDSDYIYREAENSMSAIGCYDK